MLTFKEGDPYLVSDLGAFNQALSNTGWFSSVLVEAGVDDLRDGRVPISVNLEPAARNQFETGIGYSTDTGPRVKIGWKKPGSTAGGTVLIRISIFPSPSRRWSRPTRSRWKMFSASTIRFRWVWKTSTITIPRVWSGRRPFPVTGSSIPAGNALCMCAGSILTTPRAMCPTSPTLSCRV